MLWIFRACGGVLQVKYAATTLLEYGQAGEHPVLGVFAGEWPAIQ